jgi:hypothetical protein
MKCLGEMGGGRHKSLRGVYILIPILAIVAFCGYGVFGNGQNGFINIWLSGSKGFP